MDNDIEFLLAFRWENFSEFEQDPAFQWFLEELENGIVEYMFYNCGTKVTALSTLFQTICSNEKSLNEVFKRPRLKEVITNSFARKLIPFFLERNLNLDILAFLNNYFPSIKDELKTEFIMQKKGQKNKDFKFLDLLLFNYQFWKYILPLWDEGFRPLSPVEFNQKLFNLDNSKTYCFNKEEQIALGKEIKELYTTIADNSGYEPFLIFSETMTPLLLFITNHFIDLSLFNKLQQKLETNSANEELVKALVNNKLTFSGRDIEKINMLDKLTHVLSQINSLNSPPSATFQEKIKAGVHDALLGRYAPLAGSTIFADRVSRIQPQVSFAQELLFIVAMNLFSESADYSKSIKKLCDVLKQKQVNSFELLKTLLYAYLLNVSNIENLKGYNALFMELFVALEQKNEFKDLLGEYLNDIKNVCSNFDNLRRVITNNPSLGEEIANKTVAFIESSFYSIAWQDAAISESNNSSLLKRVTIQISELLCIKISSRCSSLNGTHLLEKHMIDCFEECRVQFEKKGQYLFLDLILIGLIQLMVKLAQTPKVSLLKEIMDRDIFSANNRLPKTVKENALWVLLQTLIVQLNLKDQEHVQRNAEFIFYLFDQMDANGLLLKNKFLETVAKMELNYEEKSRLSEKAQEFLKIIYNRCIHKVQGTEQQKTFEAMRTQVLIKAKVDPSKDSQAIHTSENHEYAERIYHEWIHGLEANSIEKLKQGVWWFKEYMNQEKDKDLIHLVASMSKEMLVEYIRYGMDSSKTHKTAEVQLLIDKMAPYLNTLRFLQVTEKKSQQTQLQDQNQQQALHEIESAKKLLNLIHMISYYSMQETNQFIKDGSEAMKILKLELFDQVRNPSCDQGPFIRLIMALEPVATNIKFPWIQRRNINFLTHCYINNNYQQLSVDEKKQFIRDIYEKIDVRETINEIESIPEHAFDSLGKSFIVENKERFGVLTEKEVLELFSMERPFEYHSEIARDLKKYHIEIKSKQTDAVVSSYGFFARNSISSNLPTDDAVDSQLNELNEEANTP